MQQCSSALTIVQRINALPESKVLAALLPPVAVVVSVALVPLVAVVVPVVIAVVVAVVVAPVVVVIVVVVVEDSAGKEPGADRGFLSLDPDPVVAGVATAGAGIEGASAWLQACSKGSCTFQF